MRNPNVMHHCKPDLDQCINCRQLDLSNELRELWEQHGAWTRMTIMGIVFDLPDLPQTINRLLQNPWDFAEVFSRYYGQAIGNKLGRLLTEHLTVAAELVQAAKAGDNRRVAELDRIWHRNAGEIAELLAKINPFWSRQSWVTMLFEHLRLVRQEAVTMLQGDFQASIDTYDMIETQSLDMADVMWLGIIKQFPDRF
ncbi:MAG TPA: acetylglutamate kinase [Limnochordia bacterium]|nr:acetylglutamate kinase [Bacillota bacterium]HKM16615.1 acetylglutamate kinase [Limnochordia bacterium]